MTVFILFHVIIVSNFIDKSNYFPYSFDMHCNTIFLLVKKGLL